ncbi:hypothetical protein [Xanthomonas arboricola]
MGSKLDIRMRNGEVVVTVVPPE